MGRKLRAKGEDMPLWDMTCGQGPLHLLTRRTWQRSLNASQFPDLPLDAFFDDMVAAAYRLQGLRKKSGSWRSW